MEEKEIENIELNTENRLLKQILEQLLKIELIPKLNF